MTEVSCGFPLNQSNDYSNYPPVLKQRNDIFLQIEISSWENHQSMGIFHCHIWLLEGFQNQSFMNMSQEYTILIHHVLITHDSPTLPLSQLDLDHDS